MAKKSRRLPGGKVRRPESRDSRQRQETPPDSRGGLPAEHDVDAAAAIGPVAPAGPVAPRPRPAAAPAASPAVARPAPTPAAASPVVRRIAGREIRARGAAGRAGASLMDTVAQHYGHIRGDLTRIAIIAVVMIAIIIGLSFVLK